MWDWAFWTTVDLGQMASKMASTGVGVASSLDGTLERFRGTEGQPKAAVSCLDIVAVASTRLSW